MERSARIFKSEIVVETMEELAQSDPSYDTDGKNTNIDIENAETTENINEIDGEDIKIVEELLISPKKIDFQYEKCCRICLQPCQTEYDIFRFSITSSKVVLVEFLRKITGLLLPESDTLPNTICSSCAEKSMDCYNFIELCINSDKTLRNSETRRLLRKIEEEALTEYSRCEENDYSYETLSSTSVQDNSSDISRNNCDNDNNKVQKVETHSDVSTKYECDVCSMNFGNKTKFLQHKNTHKELPFKCTECGQAFVKNESLQVHSRKHWKDEKKKFVCKVCDSRFMFEYLLKQHEYKHSDVKPFPCTQCDKGCLTAESLKRHMKTHDENHVKKTCVCVICDKKFAFPSFLNEHMKNHTGERPYLCSVCGKGFRQSGALHFHQRIHTGTKPFKCKFCEENFRSMSKLNAHMRTHTNERPFICDICGISFKQLNGLKSHKMIHDGKKLTLCPVCGKQISSSGQLKIHLRIHTGEKPFKCEICSKSFVTKTLLNKHSRGHTGDKPYTCEICKKKFSQSSTLRVHKKSHENQKNNSNGSSVGLVKNNSVKHNINTGRKNRSKKKKNVEENKQEIVENVEIIQVMLPAPIPLL